MASDDEIRDAALAVLARATGIDPHVVGVDTDEHDRRFPWSAEIWRAGRRVEVRLCRAPSVEWYAAEDSRGWAPDKVAEVNGCMHDWADAVEAIRCHLARGEREPAVPVGVADLRRLITSARRSTDPAVHAWASRLRAEYAHVFDRRTPLSSPEDDTTAPRSSA